MIQQAGDDGEDRRVMRKREAAFRGNLRQQAMEFVEGGLRQAAVGDAGPARFGGVVVEHQTKRPAATEERKAVRNARRDNEKVAAAGGAPPAIDELPAFARKIKDELR